MAHAIQGILKQTNKSQSNRIQVRCPATPGEEVDVPQGGSFYVLVSATGTVSAHVGEDVPSILPVGLLKVLPEGVLMGRDSRNLKISSTAASDVVTLDIGFGWELPLDVLAALIIAQIPQPPYEVYPPRQYAANQLFPAATSSSYSQTVVSDLAGMLINVWSLTAGDVLDVENFVNGSVTPYAPVIYNMDGSVYATNGEFTTQGVFYVPMLGCAKIIVSAPVTNANSARADISLTQHPLQ